MLTLGQFIRARRQDLGLSQEQLARRVGESVRQAEISRLERDGVTLPRRERLEALAAALEVSIGELLVRTGWAQDGDLLAMRVEDATQGYRTPDDLDTIALQDLAAVVDSIGAVQTMVTEATVALTQAQDTIDSLMRALPIDRNTRGIIRPPAGVIKEWETVTVFQL